MLPKFRTWGCSRSSTHVSIRLWKNPVTSYKTSACPTESPALPKFRHCPLGKSDSRNCAASVLRYLLLSQLILANRSAPIEIARLCAHYPLPFTCPHKDCRWPYLRFQWPFVDFDSATWQNSWGERATFTVYFVRTHTSMKKVIPF